MVLLCWVESARVFRSLPSIKCILCCVLSLCMRFVLFDDDDICEFGTVLIRFSMLRTLQMQIECVYLYYSGGTFVYSILIYFGILRSAIAHQF